MRARPRRRDLPNDVGERSAIADNVLDRQFQADGPNQKWVADFTYIWTAEGWLYVAVVLDLYSWRIVTWSTQASMTSQLVAALMIAVATRQTAGPVHRRALPGSCWPNKASSAAPAAPARAGDNSAIESFFSSLKTERTGRRVYRGRERVRSDVFDYSSASTTRRAGIRRSATSAL